MSTCTNLWLQAPTRSPERGHSPVAEIGWNLDCYGSCESVFHTNENFTQKSIPRRLRRRGRILNINYWYVHAIDIVSKALIYL